MVRITITFKKIRITIYIKKITAKACNLRRLSF